MKQSKQTKKVKRYSKIYKSSSLKRKHKTLNLVLVYFIVFLGLATISYFMSIAFISFLRRPHCTEIGSVGEFAEDNKIEGGGIKANSKNNQFNFKNVDESIDLNLSGVEVDLNTVAKVNLFDGFLSKLEKDEKNTVVVCLKGDDGKLVYDSNLELAEKWDSVSSDSKCQINFKDMVKKIKAKGLNAVARISAFFDQTAPSVDFDNSFVFNKSGRVDSNSRVNVFSAFNGVKRGKWLNAMHAHVRNYVADIAAEIMELGFDFVLIDNLCFPIFKSSTELEYLDYYSNEEKFKSLCNFLDLLKSRGVKFVLSYPARVIYDDDFAQKLFGDVNFFDKFKNLALLFENESEIKKCEKILLDHINDHVIIAKLPFRWHNSLRIKNLLQKCLINADLVVK